jgi:peptidoglycan hydrolase-like protein with peptidoglycan-binding domain/multidrug efflux pump subunit AcrA (membrane-fusion protein)
VVAAVVASAMSGWVASATIRSPAEEAARTKPPAASTILVPVERRSLATEVITRGTARFGRPQQVSMTESALKPSPGVLSKIGTAGVNLREGATVAVQSGRPVFLIAGRLPAYRDLGPGLEGADVRQLQQALQRMGFDPGPATGVYDGRTEAAVARWYRDAGFAPFETTPDQLAEIQTREVELLTARLDMLSSNDGLALAGSDLAAAQAARADAVRIAARAPRALAKARSEATAANRAAAAEVRARQAALDALKSGKKATAAELAAAQADLVTARAEARDIHLSGLAAIAAADAEATRAVAATLAAQAALADVISVGLDEVAAAEAELAEVEADPASTAAAIAAARAALTRARVDAAAAERDARASLDDATAAQAAAAAARAAEPIRAADADTAAASRTAAAQAALDALTGPAAIGTPSEVAAAVSDLATARVSAVATQQDGARRIVEAEAALDAARAAVGPANAAVAAAATVREDAASTLALRQRVANVAEESLGTATRRAGVQVPADEFVVVPAVPARISEVSVVVGDPATGPIMKVTNLTVAVDGTLALDEAGLVHPGMPVKLDEPELGVAETGVVSEVATTPGTRGADGFHVYFEVVVDGNPKTLPGVSVRITVPVKSSGGETLVVPVTALTLAPDGSSRVQVDRNGTLEPVTVVPGLVAEGYVEVIPQGGSLDTTDQVAVSHA